MLTWSGWSEVPGNGTTNTALAGVRVSTSSGKENYLFARGLDDRVYANWTSDFKTWSNWSEVAGGGKTNAAIAAAEFGRLYLFVKGLDGHVYVNSMATDTANKTWTGWSEVPGGGITDTALAATRYGSTTVPRLHLFAKGTGEGNPWVNSTTDGKNWTGWRLVPGMNTNLAVSARAGTTDGDGRMHLVCVNKQDNQIYENLSAKTDFELKSWSGWEPLPGGGQTGAPVVVAPYNLRLHYFVTGLDRRIYTHTWSGWKEVPGSGTTHFAPAYISTGAQGNSSEHLYLFVRGDDQRIYVNKGELPDK